MYSNFIWTDKSDERNKLTQKYEPVQPFIFVSLIRMFKCTHVIDVGSNIGCYAIFSAPLGSVEKVSAFEPSPATFQELATNVALNGFGKSVDCYQYAVSDKSGVADFNIAGELSGINSISGSSFHDRSKFSREIEVQVTSLDEMFSYSQKHIAIKVDVEGNEANVLRGARDLLANNLCFIQVEDYEASGNEVESFLEKLGYEKILQVKSDKYYCKSGNISSMGELGVLMSDALTSVVEYSLRGYSGYSVHDSILAEAAHAQGAVKICCKIRGNFFEAPCEYAIYLYIHGKREKVLWYQDSSEFHIQLPSDAKPSDVKVNIFVRQKDNPVRKISKTFQLGKLL